MGCIMYLNSNIVVYGDMALALTQGQLSRPKAEGQHGHKGKLEKGFKKNQ